jgi:hypothetical protein
LGNFDVSLIAKQAAHCGPTPDSQAARWTLHGHRMLTPCYQAVAAEGKNLEFRLWDWNAWKMIIQ